MFTFPKLSKVRDNVAKINPSSPVPATTTSGEKHVALPAVEVIHLKKDIPSSSSVETIELAAGIVAGRAADEISMPCKVTIEVPEKLISIFPVESDIESIPEEIRVESDSISKEPLLQEDPRIRNMTMDIEMVREDIRVLKDFQTHVANKLKRAALKSSFSGVQILKSRLSEQEKVSQNLHHLLSEMVSHLQGQIGSVEVLQRRMQDTLDSEGSYMRGKLFDLSYETKILKDKIVMIEDRLWPSDPSKSDFWSRMKQEYEENTVYNLAQMGHLNVTALHDPTVLAMCPRRADEIRLLMSSRARTALHDPTAVGEKSHPPSWNVEPHSSSRHSKDDPPPKRLRTHSSQRK